LNRSDHGLPEEKIKNFGLNFIGAIPSDAEIEQMSLNGHSLMDLKEDARGLSAFRKLGDKIWQNP